MTRQSADPRPEVLIIEREPAATELRRMLKRRHLDATVVTSLEEGLTATKEERFAATLLGLPDRSSDTLRCVRRLAEANPAMPLVILVEDLDEELAGRVLRLGAQECLDRSNIKPVLLANRIHHAIERICGRREIEKSFCRIDDKVRQRTAELSSTVGALHAELETRRSAEERLRRDNRLLRMLLACQEALANCVSAQEAGNKVCHLIVEAGGYLAAWIGWSQDNSRAIRIGAACGLDEEQLQEMLACDGSRSSPAVKALESRRPCVCRDFVSDPSLLPWKQAGHSDGFRSSASLPIEPEAGLAGVLTVYSGQTDGFTQEQIEILQCLTRHLALALSGFGSKEDYARLEGQVIEAVDREQQRIGRDLHDGIQGALVGVSYILESLKADLVSPKVERQAVADEIDRITQTIVGLVEDTRRIARGLCPVNLAEGGLPAALQVLAEMTQKTTGIACCFEPEGSVTFKDGSVPTQLYYIACEALTNAVKHARATRIRIVLRQEPTNLCLEVEDNGVGLADRSAAEAGIGMRTVSYRARLIGATVYLSRKPDGGTLLRCSLPREPDVPATSRAER